jgi:hypothetical protein
MSVVVRLLGGLGNQIFIWAYGQSLRHRGYDVFYDKSKLIEGTHREYSLGFLDPFLPLRESNSEIVREKSHIFDPDLLWVKDGVTVESYSQSEQYFQEIAHDIRSKFNHVWMQNPLTGYAREIEQEVWTHRSVFIHVRRKDYVTLQNYHGLPSMDYYDRAINLMTEKHGGIQPPDGLKFFIFSDDPVWCKQNFSSDFHVVEGLSKYDDLRLMAGCKHAIIANSTFSWWGAWLGDNQLSRTVIAPEKWFVTDEIDYRDIVPSRWIKLA